VKELLAKEIATRVKDGQVIGLGSGSTTELAIVEIGRRIKAEGITVKGVPTSLRSANVARAAGIEVLDPETEVEIDWAFDGADEVDPQLNLIKGGGGCHTKEKIVARRAGGIVVLVTAEKLVETLGSKFDLPIECKAYVEKELLNLGAREVSVRKSSETYGPARTESGNIIIDAKFSPLDAGLESKVNSITGVVENGLFVGLSKEVLVAKDGTVQVLEAR
jgi:ribose 5-phosphate isomerase A